MGLEADHPNVDMARGPKKHMSRLATPKAWMLDKLGGAYAPKPSPGPHKQRECLPLSIFIRNRLKYALTGREVTLVVKQRLIKIDNKVRTDETYPAGFQDVISIEKSGEHFRLLYDVKGRFAIHRISEEEATYKLLKVRKVQLGAKGVPSSSPTTAAPSATRTRPSRSTTSSSLTSSRTRLSTTSSLSRATSSCSLAAVTRAVSAPSFTASATSAATTLSRSVTRSTASSPPVCRTSLSSARATSPSSRSPRARVSSSRSARSATSVAARPRSSASKRVAGCLEEEDRGG